MQPVEFKDKFVGFVDILGFKSMVSAAESGSGANLPDLLEMLKKLGTAETRMRYVEHGPRTCPESRHIRRDLDFQITQVSDCVVVSSEVSPAGAINLISHCWGSVINLLADGIMCRGFITRGSIYHDLYHFLGTAYAEAYSRERQVAVFKREANERATPFVEVDQTVCEYVSKHGDWCVNEMFRRYTITDGSSTALFPFRRLSHSVVLGGLREFDPKREKESVDNLRRGIEFCKNKVMRFVDRANPSAVSKALHRRVGRATIDLRQYRRSY